MTGNELRKMYLQFFASKGHLVQPSYSLIPDNDPSLLLIGAGMAPLKPFFTGKMKPPCARIATSQKCVRTGDIENVGRTARHHTFFEMLGNFSFGDYFKKEAIAWAWEFVTEYLRLPKEKLWVTIHTSDDEAEAIWRDEIGVESGRIIRMEENFWEIGPGPCGPCSEIYVDLGAERGCGKADCAVGCDCDRYLEIWNLVFTQFDRDEQGNYTPLAKKNIDTGAGLERIASVMQNKPSNFETDLLFPIIEYASKIAKVSYGSSAKSDVSLKVIADHARSITVMISDGILPSNEGRGYVLRRVLRRAVRHGRLLGIESVFLADAVDVVADIFTEGYPEIGEKREYIKQVITLEEKRFQETLLQGTELLNQEIALMQEVNKKQLEGAAAFKLYDTYGFPWELTQEILMEHELTLDKQGFDVAMNDQRQRARDARQDVDDKLAIPDLTELLTVETLYSPEVERAKLLLILKDGKAVSEATDGDEVIAIMDQTSFYAEGGGQVGDVGKISGAVGHARVVNTKKLPDGTIYHICIIEEGSLSANELVTIKVHAPTRRDTTRNHTATHLLHAALKQVLGGHVNQAGSFVSSERLRFDFSHFAPVSTAELIAVEKIVNDKILENIAVGIIETSQDMAKEMGAMALFGEKYGEKVRVVMVDDYSKELCGGTHVNRTGDIGLFKILSEAGIGAGLRRIEAVTGIGTQNYVAELENRLEQLAGLLKSKQEDLAGRIEGLLYQMKEAEKEVELCRGKLANSQVDELLQKKLEIGGVLLVTGSVSASDMDHLRSIGDKVRDRLPQKGVVVLGAVQDEKINFIVMATDEAVKSGVHAGNLIKEVAKIAGGSGGGRKDMAQAGGKDPSKVSAALSAAESILVKQLS